MEFTLLYAALTAAAATWLALRITGRGEETDVLLGAAVVGLLVGRLTAMVAAGVNPLTSPLDVLVVRGGVDTAGATIGALASLVWAYRGDPARLDAVAPAVLAGLAGWHGGCVWRGTCLGAAADVPWGWALPGSEIVRHPVELYAAAGLVVAALVAWKLPDRPGTRAGFALAAAGGVRLLTQPLRPSLTGGPIWWYVAAVVAGLVVMAVPFERLRPRAASGGASGRS